jgi:hypothetical protein
MSDKNFQGSVGFPYEVIKETYFEKEEKKEPLQQVLSVQENSMTGSPMRYESAVTPNLFMDEEEETSQKNPPLRLEFTNSIPMKPSPSLQRMPSIESQKPSSPVFIQSFVEEPRLERRNSVDLTSHDETDDQSSQYDTEEDSKRPRSSSLESEPKRKKTEEITIVSPKKGRPSLSKQFQTIERVAKTTARTHRGKKRESILDKPQIFKGYHFLPTHVPDYDFVIKEYGGIILTEDDFNRQDCFIGENVILISDMTRRSLKFFIALAIGAPCLNTAWIEDCIRAETMLTPTQSHYLYAGAAIDEKPGQTHFTQQDVKMFAMPAEGYDVTPHIVENRILYGARIKTVYHDEGMRVGWDRLISLTGATLEQRVSHCDFVVYNEFSSDPFVYTVPEELYEETTRDGKEIVIQEYIIQCLIAGKCLNRYSNFVVKKTHSEEDKKLEKKRVVKPPLLKKVIPPVVRPPSPEMFESPTTPLTPTTPRGKLYLNKQGKHPLAIDFTNLFGFCMDVVESRDPTKADELIKTLESNIETIGAVLNVMKDRLNK